MGGGRIRRYLCCCFNTQGRKSLQPTVIQTAEHPTDDDDDTAAATRTINDYSAAADKLIEQKVLELMRQEPQRVDTAFVDTVGDELDTYCAGPVYRELLQFVASGNATQAALLAQDIASTCYTAATHKIKLRANVAPEGPETASGGGQPNRSTMQIEEINDEEDDEDDDEDEEDDDQQRVINHVPAPSVVTTAEAAAAAPTATNTEATPTEKVIPTTTTTATAITTATTTVTTTAPTPTTTAQQEGEEAITPPAKPSSAMTVAALLQNESPQGEIQVSNTERIILGAPSSDVAQLANQLLPAEQMKAAVESQLLQEEEEEESQLVENDEKPSRTVETEITEAICEEKQDGESSSPANREGSLPTFLCTEDQQVPPPTPTEETDNSEQEVVEEEAGHQSSDEGERSSRGAVADSLRKLRNVAGAFFTPRAPAAPTATPAQEVPAAAATATQAEEVAPAAASATQPEEVAPAAATTEQAEEVAPAAAATPTPVEEVAPAAATTTPAEEVAAAKVEDEEVVPAEENKVPVDTVVVEVATQDADGEETPRADDMQLPSVHEEEDFQTTTNSDESSPATEEDIYDKMINDTVTDLVDEIDRAGQTPPDLALFGAAYSRP